MVAFAFFVRSNHLRMPAVAGPRSIIKAGTVDNYVSAACSALRALHGCSDLRFIPSTGKRCTEYVKLLSRFKRTDPARILRSPSTFEELIAAWRATSNPESDPYLRWAIIGIFFGLRGTEYLLSPYNSKHKNIDGSLKELFFSDVTFEVAPEFRTIPGIELTMTLGQVSGVDVLFRFQKNGDNFIHRFHRKTGHAIFCPVIQLWAAKTNFEQIAPRQVAASPLAVCAGGQQLTVAKMEKTLKKAARAFNPHITASALRLVTVHSIRVGALHRALLQVNPIVELICFFLRWNSDAYKLYVRAGQHNFSTLSAAEQFALRDEFLADAADDGEDDDDELAGDD